VFTRGARNVGCKNKIFFIFLGIFRDERFIFVISSFGRVEIEFDAGFIVRSINMNEIQMSLLEGGGTTRSTPLQCLLHVW
jgi:hypothetical protein